MRTSKWFLVSCALVLVLPLLAGCATAPSTAKAPTTATTVSTQPSALPPLIDRNLFLDDPKIAGAQVSPDGHFISFRKPYHGIMNIWVKGIDEPFESARPLTADTERPVREYFWSQDGRFILYSQDKGGNENFHVHAVDPAAAVDEKTGVPPGRDLTPLPNVRAYIYAVPKKTPNEILVGMNDRDPALHDVYRLNLTTGEKTLLIRNDENVAFWIADLDGNVRLAFRQAPDGSNETLRVDGGKLGPVIYTCSWEETCAPLRFHKNGREVYFVTNKGSDVDLTQLTLMDPATGKTTYLESDPEKEVDFGAPVFSEKTDELVATAYVGDRLRIYPKNAEFAAMLADIRSKVPDGELGFTSSTSDERLMTIAVSSDVDPGSVYLYDTAARKATLLYRSRPELPSDQLAAMKPVRYQARDGATIPAYLTLPRGVEAKNLPTVILPHGGPWARDDWGYDYQAQFLANRGYAVLQPNFRSSTGYGKKFLNAGAKQWGTGIMQNDLTDAVKYLVGQGIADPKRVAIMGGSYGGYATLAGLAFTPDIYAAGVSIVGPSNLFTLLNSIPPYWAPMRRVMLLRMGDPAVPEEKAMLEAQSPLFHATAIKAPLLVVQGANDPRVKKAESDQIVIALRDLGRKVDYMVAPDEGHGFAGRDNRIAQWTEIEKFLAEQIGGRYQKDMPPEIAAKLKTLIVDPASVQAPQLATGLDSAKVVSLPVPDVKSLGAQTLAYKTTLKLAGGREVALDSSRTISTQTDGGRAVWKIASSMQSPMGSGTDTYILDAATLRPLSHNVQQGMATIDLKYGDAAVSGSIKAGPQTIPIDLKIDAPLFGDGAALETVVCALPLAPAYHTTVRTAEIGMAQRVRYWSVDVKGTESVTVPAGTFQAFEVVLAPLDGEPGGQTFWISTEAPRAVVRAEAQLPPAMGGGTATTELTGKK